MSTRPRVVTGNITTLDGRIAVSSSVPAWRDERWAPVERAGYELVDVAVLHGAVIRLEGSNSFVARDAGPAAFPKPSESDRLYEDFLPAPLLDRVKGWMAVPDSRGRVAWSQTGGDDVHLLVLVSRSTPSGYLAFLRERDISYLVVGDQRVELERALRRLADTFHTELIVSTAGGVLNGALLRAELVDEVDVQILPIVLGQEGAPSIFEGYGSALTNQPLRLRLLDEEKRPDGSLFLRLAPDKQLE